MGGWLDGMGMLHRVPSSGERRAGTARELFPDALSASPTANIIVDSAFSNHIKMLKPPFIILSDTHLPLAVAGRKQGGGEANVRRGGGSW
ncbi:hypothetical protein V6N12_065452 [Hibiscus sabdariffa]|uniref:Uncharacterized protein n=1 Tax=Hibiscus sabdariffa TaxID=183260 RepID=A0ABR2G9P6_9ROSI